MTGGRANKNRDSRRGLDETRPVFRVSLGERLSALLDRFATRAEAGAVAGVTPEQLAKYVGGRAKPPFEVVSRLAAAHGASLDWLATGEGASELGGAGAPEGYVRIALHGDGDPSTDYLAFARAWIADALGTDESGLAAVVNRGDANAPDIGDGDVVLVDRGADRLAGDAYYAFERDGQFLIRKTERYVDGRVALKSRNPAYERQVLTPAEAARLSVFGRVVWAGGVV